MSMGAVLTRYSPEDLLTMEDGDRYELVGGELVEKPVGFKSSNVAGELLYRLKEFCKARKFAAWVLPADTSYQCFADANMVRRPDVSLVAEHRLPVRTEPRGHCRIAPDLAVEVTSPNDIYERILKKVTEYQSAGVRLIWVIDSESGRTLIFRPIGPGTILSMNDELDGEDVVPGFRCKIAELFKLPVEA